MVISLSDHEIDLILPLKHGDSCFISVLFLSNKNCLLSFGRKCMCHSLNLATDVSQLENKVNVKQNRITKCLRLKGNSGDDLLQPPGSKQVEDLEEIAGNHAQPVFGYLQGWRPHNLCRHPIPVCDPPRSKKFLTF